MYIDIEPGCFMDADEVRGEGTRLTFHRLKTGIYTNVTPFQATFGASKECAEWPCPLWFASWNQIPYREFIGFNGWTKPELWQFSEKGFAGLNCDLSLDEAGNLWADISNYSDIENFQAHILKAACYGVVIGLQNFGKAHYQYQLLTS